MPNFEGPKGRKLSSPRLKFKVVWLDHSYWRTFARSKSPALFSNKKPGEILSLN